ncbi:MAG: hypothetical protein R3245_10670, partial [Kiloniellales bacterium]|nr:hypothetical protein [Kiloniellales bacterium]
TGDVDVDLHSVLRLGNSGFDPMDEKTSYDGFMTISRDSAMVSENAGVEVEGEIRCADKESSVSGAFKGSAKLKNCTDFNR